MHVRVKICGITTAKAAIAAVEAGADAVGFVFAQSPRRVTAPQAADLAAHLSPFVCKVAVFHYPTRKEISHVISNFQPDVVQSEPCDGMLDAVADGVAILPVFHDSQNLVADVQRFWDSLGSRPAILLEASGRGGRGAIPSWERAAQLAHGARLVLAGGLTPNNVSDAIKRVRPYAVDVSSGVESSTGVKDAERIAKFIRSVQRTAGTLDGETMS